MSNTEWVDTIKRDCPHVLAKNVFHRPKIGGKGKNTLNVDDLRGKKNILLIIDEVDVATKATKKKQTIHKALEAAGILDMNYMRENNVRIVAISATICEEFRAMKKFGEDNAKSYSMTIPNEYVGVETMKNKGILKPAPVIKSIKQMVKFIINALSYFGKNDPRVHIIRGTKKTRDYVVAACGELNIPIYDHWDKSKLSHKDLEKIFNTEQHVVIFVKNMFGRADFIPNEMKMKIGFWMDKQVKEKSRNANVQLQAGIGRMSGFYMGELVKGHKMGYIFTNLNSVDEYINFYRNPSLSIVKTHGKSPFLQPKYVKNAVVVCSDEIDRQLNDLPMIRSENSFRVYQKQGDFKGSIKTIKKITTDKGIKKGYNFKNVWTPKRLEKDGGFYTCKICGDKTDTAMAHHIKDAIKSIQAGFGKGSNNSWRNGYPCYLDLSNKNTLVWVVLIQPGDEQYLPLVDKKFPDHMNDWEVQSINED